MGIALPLTLARRCQITVPEVDVVRPAFEFVSASCGNYHEPSLLLLKQTFAVVRPTASHESLVTCRYYDGLRVWVGFEVLVDVVCVTLSALWL
jgi:hypothetical protein